MNKHLWALGLAVMTTFGIILVCLGLMLIVPGESMLGWKETIAGCIIMLLGFISITISINCSPSTRRKS